MPALLAGRAHPCAPRKPAAKGEQLTSSVDDFPLPAVCCLQGTGLPAEAAKPALSTFEQKAAYEQELLVGALLQL